MAEREVERGTKQKTKGGLQMEFDDLDDEYLEEYPVDDLYDEDEDFDLEDEASAIASGTRLTKRNQNF